MQAFKSFFKIAKKKAPSLTVYAIIYLILIVVMSNVSMDDATNFQMSSLNVAVIDEDHSTASEALVEYLGSIHTVEEFSDANEEQIQDNLYYGMISYALIIPEGFEEKLLAGETENLLQEGMSHQSADGYYIDQQVNAYLTACSLYLNGGFELKDALDKTSDSIQDLPEVTVVADEASDSQEVSSASYYFQYLAYFLLTILLMGMTSVLIVFRQEDRERRINCSSQPMLVRNIQISLAAIVYSISMWILFLLVAFFIYGADEILGQKGLLCIGNSFAFLLVTIALTLFISLFSPGGNALNMITNILGLGMSFLCGVFVSQSYLSQGVLNVARFLPVYWYVRANNLIYGISDEVFTRDSYLMCIGIQLLFAIALFVAYLVGNKQLKQKKNG
ncbi:MAG: ABC transporter permease [Lachnospiraceae bacterium]|nr:ABC transporter permease [Lachnospiraceae bacterium]